MKTTITKDGYEPVVCEQPLLCPFCGSPAELAQLSHITRSERIGRSKNFKQVRICIFASTRTLKSDTFWFKCSECKATTGGHHSDAEDAAAAWNRRAGS